MLTVYEHYMVCICCYTRIYNGSIFVDATFNLNTQNIKFHSNHFAKHYINVQLLFWEIFKLKFYKVQIINMIYIYRVSAPINALHPMIAQHAPMSAHAFVHNRRILHRVFSTVGSCIVCSSPSDLTSCVFHRPSDLCTLPRCFSEVPLPRCCDDGLSLKQARLSSL